MTGRILIVNADDYARSAGISVGIREAHLNGIVTSTTVMMNLVDAVDQVQEAIRSTPKLGLGVHLNLTSGPPCAPAEKVASLIGPTGRFLDQQHLFEHPDRIKPAQVELEWRTQIETFLATGASPDHLDSHHHIAILSPHIWELYLRIAQDYGCSVRTPDPWDVPDESLIGAYSPHLLEFIRHEARPLARRLGVPHPDHFLASFYGPTATLENLLEILINLPEGISELMCHPGYSNASLERSSGYAKVRERELKALTDSQTVKQVAEANIRLSTFREACQAD